MEHIFHLIRHKNVSIYSGKECNIAGVLNYSIFVYKNQHNAVNILNNPHSCTEHQTSCCKCFK